MAQDLFDRCSEFTATEEGGYQCGQNDPGNWSGGEIGRGNLVGSNLGISAPVLIAWNGIGTDRDSQIVAMKGLDRSTFRAIARSRYWRGLGCDGLPAPVALMMFDFGFNAGVSRAGRMLQAVLGMDAADLDGDVGPKTQRLAAAPRWQGVAALLAAPDAIQLQTACGERPDGRLGPASVAALSHRPELWPTALACALANRQAATYRTLAGFDRFGAGWLARADRRRAAALNLACPAETLAAVA